MSDIKERKIEIEREIDDLNRFVANLLATNKEIPEELTKHIENLMSEKTAIELSKKLSEVDEVDELEKELYKLNMIIIDSINTEGKYDLEDGIISEIQKRLSDLVNIKNALNIEKISEKELGASGAGVDIGLGGAGGPSIERDIYGQRIGTVFNAKFKTVDEFNDCRPGFSSVGDPNICMKSKVLTQVFIEQIYRQLFIINAVGDGKCFYHALALALKIDYPEYTFKNSITANEIEIKFINDESGISAKSEQFRHILIDYNNDTSKKEIEGLEGGTIIENIVGERTQGQTEVIEWIASVLQINIIIMDIENNSLTYYLNRNSTTNVFLQNTGGHFRALINIENIEKITIWSEVIDELKYYKKYLKYKNKYLLLKLKRK